MMALLEPCPIGCMHLHTSYAMVCYAARVMLKRAMVMLPEKVIALYVIIIRHTE